MVKTPRMHNGTDTIRETGKLAPRSHSQRPIGDQITSLVLNIKRVEASLMKAARDGAIEKVSNLSSHLANQKERLGILADQYSKTERNRMGSPIIKRGHFEGRGTHTTDKVTDRSPGMSGHKAKGFFNPPGARLADKGRRLAPSDGDHVKALEEHAKAHALDSAKARKR